MLKLEKKVSDLERRVVALETPENQDDFPRKRWHTIKSVSSIYDIPETTLRYRCQHKLIVAKQVGKVWLIDTQNLPDDYEIDEDP
jgi:hypothetical protein